MQPLIKKDKMMGKSNSYLFQNKPQVGINILTYNDVEGMPHILLSNIDPRWPAKNNAGFLQNVGGKVDATDRQHTLLKALPSKLRLAFNENLLNQAPSFNRTIEERHEYLEHMETLLEGTLRETYEETNLRVETLLQLNQDESFVQYKIHEPLEHPLTQDTDLHYFHVHLGTLTSAQEITVKEQLAPDQRLSVKGELLAAGFVPASAFKEVKSQGVIVERPFDYMGTRGDWVRMSAAQFEKLTDDQKKLALAIDRSCQHDPQACLSKEASNPSRQTFPEPTSISSDNGQLILSIFKDLEKKKHLPRQEILAPAAELSRKFSASHGLGQRA